jgi:hypothetical protein
VTEADFVGKHAQFMDPIAFSQLAASHSTVTF